jgi:hypothetical protein
MNHRHEPSTNSDIISSEPAATSFPIPVFSPQQSPVPVAQPKPVRHRTSREELQMSRMTYDGLLLQSQLGCGELRSIAEIAERLFTRDGEQPGAVALARAQRAALNLVTMGYAIGLPQNSKGKAAKALTHIQSTASPGTQLGALMNIAVRRAVAAREDERRAEQEQPADEQPHEPAQGRPTLADLDGTIYATVDSDLAIA